ncbi:MAG: hypothetical protein ATN34_05210 [Epulopiscium sp. Nele67-Bin002]|nr:MAG: hypothetical protein BEN18_07955 [Epulopiscium sp. Nuni2H_MBin001]OON91243.1 MAG: hypothetical protein ATN34_05210 [Epulopiscium sp. Nele67-Bin002]OON92506.1 MAG: hypothetical protein ATN33_07175 [Epulopiscium sp. Nele67-Bin001]
MKINFNHVSKQYGNYPVLKNISMELNSGNIYGLVGPNGAGKTTLIKLLTTIDVPTKGKIYLDGKDIAQDPTCMRGNLGYLPQDVNVYPYLTSVEYLTYFAGIKGIDKKTIKPHVQELLELFNLTPHVKKKLGTYSGGMKQRVGLACALLGNPQIIVLDEPSVGLDPEERLNLRLLFEELAKTRILILATHIISDIDLTAKQIIVLKKGEVKYTGTKDEFVKSYDGDLEEAYMHFVAS